MKEFSFITMIKQSLCSKEYWTICYSKVFIVSYVIESLPFVMWTMILSYADAKTVNRINQTVLCLGGKLIQLIRNVKTGTTCL